MSRVRWALIVLVAGERFSIRMIDEARIAAWTDPDCGWTVLARESELFAQQVEDVREDDERRHS